MKNNIKAIDVTKSSKSQKQTNKGIESKCWLNFDGVDYLYKYNPKDQDVTFGEVFVSQLCKELGIECVDACFGKGKICVKQNNGLENEIETRGCLVKSYLDENVIESVSLETVDISVNKLTMEEYTPDRIYNDLIKFSGDEIKVDSDVLQKLKTITLFDYLTVQADRHDQNVEFLVYESHGEKHLKLAPMFDNGRCFNFMIQDESLIDDQDEIFITGETSFWFMEASLNRDDHSLADCVYGFAREFETNNDLKTLFEKMKNFDMQAFMDNFVQKSEEKISKMSQLQVVQTWNHRIEKIAKAIQEYQKPDVKSKIEKYIAIRERQSTISKNQLDKTDFHINFCYDLNHGGTRTLLEYYKQDKQYRKQLKAWENFESDSFKTIDEYPLLKPRCSESEKKYFQNMILWEQSSRKSEMRDFKRSELVPDYLILDLMQGLKDIKEGKSKKTVEQLYGENNEAKKFINKYIEKWIKFGDALLKKPSIETLKIDTTKKYDDDILEKYIENYETGKGKRSAAYKNWLKKVGKVQFASRFRHEIID